MSEAPGSGYESLSVSLARRVDAICNRFEQAWKEGQAPVIEDYLAEAPAPQRAALLRELIALEMAYRRRAGEQPQAAAYHARFPELAPGLSPTDADTPGPAAPTAGPGSAALPDVPGYKILQELGRGGMGVVYWAWQSGLHRPVGLKMILAGAHAGPSELARFRTEAEAAARLQHAHIVQIHDIGQHDGRPFLALEYVDGGSLARQLDGTPWPAARAAPLMETLARAIGHAHRQGVVHRDLKPGNVLLTQEGQPKVTDFGLAKLLVGGGDPLTRTGAILGTPSYMAPEQAEGKTGEIGPAADVYALGAILYELLTGRPPFKAATPLETVRQVVSTEPVSPRRLQPGVPRDLETICLKCLHKEPGRRYATAEELAEDLRRFQAREPIVARPVGPLERGWKWARRRPAAAALLGVLILVLAGGVMAALWYADRERDLRQAAEDQRERAIEEKNRADQEAAIATAVRRFLQDDLLRQASSRTQADRQFTPDPNVTVRTLLDRAARDVGERFRDQPRVAAAIHHAIGDAYEGVGEYQPAIEHLSVARDLTTAHRGADHPDTLAVLFSLADACYGAGRTAEAIPLFERVRDAQIRQLGPDHLETLTTLNKLALAYEAAGRTTEALTLYERVREQRLRQLGPAHPATLTALHNLAGAYRSVGRITEAISLLQEVREQEVRKLGPDHPDTLATLNDLAYAYVTAGQPDQAIPLLEQVREQATKKLGPDHPHTLTTLNNLAYTYLAAGRAAKAIPLFEQAREQLTQKVGADHPNTLTTLDNLANAYRNAGRISDAVRLLEEVREQRIRKLGADHPDTLVTLNNLARAYRDAGRAAEAIPLFEVVRRQQIQKLGRDHPHTLTTLDNLAGTYAEADRFADAVQLFEEVQEARTRKLGPDHPDTLITMRNLADTLAGGKQFDRALTLYREVLGIQSRRLPADAPARADTLVELGSCLLDTGQPAAAEPILRECLAVREKKQPDRWATFQAQSLLGASLAGQQKFVEAEPLLLRGYEGMRQREAKIPGQPRARLTEALDRLVQLYDAWGKPDQAARWRAELEKLPKLPEPPKAK